MARREPIEIVLGERTFKLRALTIDQMQAIEAAVGAGKAGLAAAAAVLQIALERDHPSEVVGGLECEVRDVLDAFQQILRHGGFASGEAPAAAGTQTETGARTGAGSADASPPASG